MEKIIPPGMRSSLERNRSAMNSIFEFHRSVNREPDYDDILLMFYRIISPVYERGREFADDLLCGIFDSVLKLCGKGYIGRGGRFPAVEDLFFTMLNSFGDLLTAQKDFPVVLFNALFNVYQKSEEAMKDWGDKMPLLSCSDDFESFRKKGFILAWRLGVARYRERALELIDSLSADDIRKIFEPENFNNDDTEEFISSLKINLWKNPGNISAEAKPVFLFTDGFRGYGGHFSNIPSVFSSDGELYAADGDAVFRIYADIFGVELVHEPEMVQVKKNRSDAGLVYGSTGEIILNGRSTPLPEFCRGDIRSSASAGQTIAWTVNSSYKIFIAGIVAGHG
ncbi:MAG TPA: hypothetical protein P5120_11985 [Spirochaetota bacterium]|nr:hypothetical protein [Spirochaetota bacterium]